MKSHSVPYIDIFTNVQNYFRPNSFGAKFSLKYKINKMRVLINKDINGKEIPTHIYMIDENLAKEYKSLVKKKEEYKNSWLIKNKLPKDLFVVKLCYG